MHSACECSDTGPHTRRARSACRQNIADMSASNTSVETTMECGRVLFSMKTHQTSVGFRSQEVVVNKTMAAVGENAVDEDVK